jgi:pilus assembly protein CpaF
MPAQSFANRRRGGEKSGDSFEDLKRIIHDKLVEKLDLSRLGDLRGDTLRREIRLVIEHLCDTENPLLNRSERERLIEEILDETFGFGPLEMLLKEPGVTDIMINGPKHVFVEKTAGFNDRKRRFATTIICCRFSTGSFRRSAVVLTRPRRWSMPDCRTALD